MMPEPKDIDVLILCGGLGRRLRSIVNDRPKAMVEIMQRPFMDILITYLLKSEFRRFIFNIGYMGDKIRRYYAQKKYLNIRFSQEETLLGTGGAIKKAKALISSNPFLVLNGDSFCRVNLKRFLKFHNKKNALLSIVLTKSKKKKDFGSVKLGPLNKKIISFNEKIGLKNHSCLVSAGIYLFDKKIFSLMPIKKRFSLEYDLFPNLVDKKFYGYLTRNALIDIGTPQGLKHARLSFRYFI